MMRRTLAAALAAAALTSACGSAQGATGPSGPVDAAPATVAVARADLTSVLTLDAQVVAGPSYAVTAPAAGSVVSFDGRTVRFETSGGEQVINLPAGSSVVEELVAPGSAVPENYPIARAEHLGFALEAHVPDHLRYRLYGPPLGGRGQITDGPGPFDCALLDRVAGPAALPAAIPDVAAPPAPAPVSLRCAVPADLTVQAGMPALMAVATGEASGVLALPITAVAGSAQAGEVTVMESGVPVARAVELGITDGAMIEIRSGLAEGELVTIPGPNLGGGG